MRAARHVALAFFACAAANMRLRSDVASEINAMKPTTDRIVAAATTGSLATGTESLFSTLANFTDWVGPRMSGTTELNSSIELQRDIWLAEGIADSVTLEEVLVPQWRRGQDQANPVQDAFLQFPLMGGNQKRLTILSGGQSVGTYGNDGTGPLGTPITAEAVVVGFDCGSGANCPELDQLNAQEPLAGKIIVWYNYCGPRWRGYNSALRSQGAVYAQQVGAIASLSCSCTAYGVDTPHTGATTTVYAAGSGAPGTPEGGVPSAILTIEDTQLLDRITRRGQVPIVSLAMDCEVLPEVPSFNIVAEYRGTTHPEQIVMIGGHYDSWDLGTGAMDDMGGVYLGYQAIKLYHSLGIRPKRTVRVLGWTAEEVYWPVSSRPAGSEDCGFAGSCPYFDRHRGEAANMMIAMESDGGLFRPQGLAATTSEGGRKILEQVGSSLLGDADAEGYHPTEIGSGGGGADVNMWRQEQVSTASPYLDPLQEAPGYIDTRRRLGATLSQYVPRRLIDIYDGIIGYRGVNDYFNYHHTEGDTISVFNSADVNRCLAVWAVHTWAIADMTEKFPRLNGGTEFLEEAPSGLSLNTEETVGVAIGALAVAGAAAGIFMKFKLERGQQGPLLTSSSDAHQALATSDHEAAAVTEGSEACSI